MNPEIHYLKRSKTGIYDQIVCEECERRFQDWDDHAAKMLLNPDAQEAVFFQPNNPPALLIPCADPERLQMFFLSVMWRSSVSRKEIFGAFSIGPKHEQVVAEIILEHDVDKAFEYGTSLAWHPDELAQRIILAPERQRLPRSSINWNVLYLGKFRAYVKTDQRPIENRMKECVLQPGMPVFAIPKAYHGTSLEKRVLKTVMSHVEKRDAFQ